MHQNTVNLALKTQENAVEINRKNPLEVSLILSSAQTHYVFHRNNLYAQYEKNDNYTRNLIIVQLFLCQRIPQIMLANVFQITVQHISNLVGKYRRLGSAGLQDRTIVRIANNQKIKGNIAKRIRKLLSVPEKERPTYTAICQIILQKDGIKISPQRVSGWWRDNQLAQLKQAPIREAIKDQQIPLILDEKNPLVDAENKQNTLTEQTVDDNEKKTQDEDTEVAEIKNDWQPNQVAGSFILYAMLNKSQFLHPFTKHIKDVIKNRSKSVERIMLTLFFMHALRLKNIEQTKHLLSAHFGPLVLGAFCRLQNLRYAIDDITQQKHFDKAVQAHYQNITQHTDLGDDIYYTDGHFSCYYGKYTIPKGYDAKKQKVARGRNTIYLHNSLGHNLIAFESPTNVPLNVDIVTLIQKMKDSFGDVKGKTLFFDRGGFSAECFKQIKQSDMYFTTYLKHRKKEAEIDETLFEEIEITLNGETLKNRLYETEKQSKKYGTLRTVLFLGKHNKQIPVISTNLSLSAAEIVARLQKRWVEENGFKYMDEHFNIDLLTTYETEEAPDKIMSRPNPDRKSMNKTIAEKKVTLNTLKEQYATKFNAVNDKNEVTIAAFETQENALKWQIKAIEMDLGLLKLKRLEIPSKVETNLKDESVISHQKRRMFINLVKTMNYNCEKWLQQIFCQYHPHANETLDLIRHVLTQPGRIRQCGQMIEVELERLASEVSAKTLDQVLKKLKKDNDLLLPDGRKLKIYQASRGGAT